MLGMGVLYAVGGYLGVRTLLTYRAETEKFRQAWIESATTEPDARAPEIKTAPGAKPVDVLVGIYINSIGKFFLKESGWTYGLLANHIWSFAGWGDRDVNATFLQPFVSYTTKTFTTFGLNTESTYDWKNEGWTVPINATVSQLLKIGKQPISLQLGGRYYADRPSGGSDWGLRFTLTLLFPK